MKSFGLLIFRCVFGLDIAPKSQVGFDKLYYEITPETDNCYPTYEVNLNLADAQTNFGSSALIENFGQEVQVQANDLKLIYNRDSTIPKESLSIEPTANLTENLNSGKIWCWTTTDNFEVFFAFIKAGESTFKDLCENPSRLDDAKLVELLCNSADETLAWYMKKDNSNFRGNAYPAQPIDESTLPTSISTTFCGSSDEYCSSDIILQKLGDNTLASFYFFQSFLGACQSSPVSVKKKIVKKRCPQIASNIAELTGLTNTNICATKKCLETVPLTVQNAAGNSVDLTSPSSSYVQTMELRIETSSGPSGYTISAAMLIIDYSNEAPKPTIISILEGSLSENSALQSHILPGKELQTSPSLDFTSCLITDYGINFGEDHIMSCSLSVALDGTCDNDVLAIKNQINLEFGKTATLGPENIAIQNKIEDLGDCVYPLAFQTTILYDEGAPNFEYSIVGAQNEYFYHSNTTTFSSDSSYKIEHRVVFVKYSHQSADIFSSLLGSCDNSELCIPNASTIAPVCFAIVLTIFLLWIYASRDDQMHLKLKLH